MNRVRSGVKQPRAETRTISLHRACLLTLFVFLVGCAPRLSAQEAAVEIVTDRALVADCTYLGPVYGEERSMGGLLLGGAAESNALARLKQEAAQLGGNTVALASKNTGFDGSQTLGEAFQCAV